MRWRTAEGTLTSPSVNGVSRRRLLTLAVVAGMRECFGARLGILTGSGVNEVNRRHLLELPISAQVRESVGAL